MSITDDLREWWVRKFPVMDKELHEDFTAIADRIDEKHYDAQADAYDNGVNYVFNNPTLFGLMPLPKDADGKYIHIGDMMENLREDFEPPFHHTFRVYGIQYRAYGQECTLTEDGYPSIQYRASEVRHHHEPTVEDVLREFYTLAVRGKETHADDVDDAVLAEYAAKLQLKEPRE